MGCSSLSPYTLKDLRKALHKGSENFRWINQVPHWILPHEIPTSFEVELEFWIAYGKTEPWTKIEHVLCSASKLSTLFWKIVRPSWSKVSEKLSNGIKVSVGQSFLELLIKIYKISFDQYIAFCQGLAFYLCVSALMMKSKTSCASSERLVCSSFASGRLSRLRCLILAPRARGLFLTDRVKPSFWQRLINTCNCTATWPAKIFISFLTLSDNLLQDVNIIFLNSGDNLLDCLVIILS